MTDSISTSGDCGKVSQQNLFSIKVIKMPVGAALFGNTATRSQNKHLVECKAGKMTLKGKMVHPDKRKGVLYVYQSDDSLMHFCWKDRQSGTVEDDLIIFPDDCEFKRVTQCTTGRVYVLKFKSSNRKFFFWVQEPKTDKDEENCRRINEVLNNPPTPGSQRSGGGTPDGGDLQNLLNNMSQQQLMQLFGGVGQIGGLSSLLGTMSRPSTSQSTRSGGSSASSTLGSGGTTASSATTNVTATTTAPTTTTSTTTTAAATGTTTATTTASTTAPPAVTTTTTANTSKPAVVATAASTASSAPIQLSDLQSFLSGMNVPQPGGSSRRAVDLAAALTSDNLQSVLGDPGLVQELQQHLPSISGAAAVGSTPPPTEQLRSTLASPQFQQALSMFSAALQSGQLGPIVQQFEVGAEAVDAANQGNMEEFVKALQKATIAGSKDEPAEKQPGGDEKRKKKDDAPPPDNKDDDEDEGMSMD